MNKTTLRTACAALALLTTGALTAQAQTQPDMERINASMQKMESTINQLMTRIAELEKERDAARAAAAPAAYAATGQAGAPSAGAPAAQPADLLDSDGYITLPRTGLKARLNVKPRLDITMDSRNSGNEDRFVTAQIPVKGSADYGGGEHFNMNMKATTITFDVVSNDSDKFAFHYDNDFFGRGDNDYNFRVNQIWVRYGNLIVGQGVLPFEDSDIWADTVDFEGINAQTYARQPMIRYNYSINNEWSSAFALSKPVAYVDSGTLDADDNPIDADVTKRMPDFSANIRWERESFGHIQLSGMAREITADNGNGRGKQDVFGWGLSLSGVIKITENDSVQLMANYGQGTFSYMNDAFISGDASYNNAGDLKALTYKGFLAAYSHRWNESWRSTATYGWLQIDNEGGQTGDAYHRTQYASVNAIWTVMPRWDIGFEVLYGYKKENSGASGDVLRAQVAFMYSLF
ncbi:hypothetical protein Ga0100231_011400 [Opitutaceae bacterium TAV4]|nr:hypothetical protein Ga0100231_011400 [Opitutaceae bacterium TAV4]RRJ99079.1 hypothetical protein Ga0100230_012555 [Opitutaceae bacterium TAV3]